MSCLSYILCCWLTDPNRPRIAGGRFPIRAFGGKLITCPAAKSAKGLNRWVIDKLELVVNDVSDEFLTKGYFVA